MTLLQVLQIILLVLALVFSLGYDLRVATVLIVVYLFLTSGILRL